LKRITLYFQTLLLFLSIVYVTKAQNVACFTTSAVKGCVPFTVTVDASCAINNSGNPPNYNYDFLNDPTNFVTATSHTYTVAGKYTIHQIIATGNIFYDIVVEATDPIAPQFTLTSCSGRLVSAFIDDISSPPYDKFIVDFGDGSPTQTVSDGSTVNHVYPTEGSKSVTVTGVYNPNQSCKSSTQTTYALTGVIKPDIIDLRVLTQRTSNGSIALRFNSITGQKYRIESMVNNSGFFSVISDTLYGNNSILTYTDINLNTAADLHEYMIVAFDDCNTKVSSSVLSNVFISATPSDLLNSVSWIGPGNYSSHTLTKDGVPQSLPITQPYIDTDVECGKTYCYQATVFLTSLTLSGTPHKCYSIDTCIQAVSTTRPAKLEQFDVTMNGNTALLTWKSTGATSYSIYSVSGSTPTLITTTPTNSYTAFNLDPNKSHCYSIDYKNVCGTLSFPSSTVCAVILNSNMIGNTIALNWNDYYGFDASGNHGYVLQKLDENGNILSEINVGPATTYSEAVNLNEPYLNYRIKVSPLNPVYQPVFSNNSIFTFEAQLFVPDIFTPNGDGSNEVFKVKAKYVKTYSITIFSRWGEVVYASNSINEGWDGLDRNVHAIEGAYTYKIVATDIHDKEFIQTGTVTLTR